MIAVSPKRKRRRNQVSPNDLGTEQTRKRLKRETTLQRLMREEKKRGNRNTPELERAAFEIERVFFENTRRLFAKSASYERIDGGEPASTPEWLVSVYTDRYIPWTETLKSLKKSRAVAVVIDVVVESRSLKDIEHRYKFSRGMAKQVTLASLKLYADMAGWGQRENKKHKETAQCAL